MKQRMILMGLLVLCSLGCGKRNAIGLIPPSQRPQATEIKADFLNSNNLHLASVKGKVVMLDFWATWCGPCRMEIPTIEKMYETYHPKGLEVWGLSVEASDGQPKDYFDKFISGFSIRYPIGLADTDTLKAYGINPIPTTFFIDKKGKIALSFVGAHSEEDFTYAIEKLFAE
ncbi:MAG TPA: TlpA disulfide reductase family protein [Puia sp.]|nr:TlpA disulfide reductase family protein [Puia sp.]